MFKSFLISLLTVLAISGSCFARELPAEPQVDKVPGQQVSLPHKHTLACARTEAEPVQIICILDRSGSMRHLTEDTIGGYNSFLAKQRQEKGKAQVTTVLFDDQYDKIVDSVDLEKVPDLTSREYYARGMTALLDAVGRTIADTAGRMEKEGICPARRKVLFLIMTDGQENNSKEYSREAVKAMIEYATKEYEWNFIFMGANIDSVAEAGSIGISAKHAANYAHDSDGVQDSFDMMSAAAVEMRETGSVGEDWKTGK